MKRLIVMALAVVLVSAVSFAQNNNRSNRRQRNTAEMQARMAERLADQMKLDKDKQELFKVLYLYYQTARQNAVNPKGEEEERIDLKKISDEEATQLIDKQLKGQEAQLAVDKEYLPKFLEILTPSQAAYIYVRGANVRGNNNSGGRQGGFGGGFPGGGFPGGGFPGGGFGGPDM